MIIGNGDSGREPVASIDLSDSAARAAHEAKLGAADGLAVAEFGVFGWGTGQLMTPRGAALRHRERSIAS